MRRCLRDRNRRRPSCRRTTVRKNALALLRLARGGLQQLAPHAARQQPDAVGEETEHELVDEMRHRLAVGIAVLQRVRDRSGTCRPPPWSVSRACGPSAACRDRGKRRAKFRDFAARRDRRVSNSYWRGLRWSSASRCGRDGCRRRRAAAGFRAPRRSGSAVPAPCRGRASSSCIPRRKSPSSRRRRNRRRRRSSRRPSRR